MELSQTPGQPLPSNLDEAEKAFDEMGNPLDPPYLLVREIAHRKLLSSTVDGAKAVSERRIQEMILAGTLPACKATFEQEILLLKNGRVRRITDTGVWLIKPSALVHAEQTRKNVGFPKGQKRPMRGTKTGAGEAHS